MPRKKPSRNPPAPATSGSSAPEPSSSSAPSIESLAKPSKFRSLKLEDVKRIDDVVSAKIRPISESRKELLFERDPKIDTTAAEFDSYWVILTKEEKRLNMDMLKNYLGSDSKSALYVFRKGMEFLKKAKTLKGYACPVCEYISATIKQWESHIRQCFWNPSPILYELGILQVIIMSDEEQHHGDDDDDVVVDNDNDDIMVVGKIQFEWDSSPVKKESKRKLIVDVLSDFIRLVVVVENLAAMNFNQIGCLKILREFKKMDSPRSSLVELKKQLEGKTRLNGVEQFKLILLTGIIDRAMTRNKKITNKGVFDEIQYHQKKSEEQMSKVIEDIKECAQEMMEKQFELASACVYDFKPQLIALYRSCMQRRLEKEVDWHLQLEKRLRSDFEATMAKEMSKLHEELKKNAEEIEILKKSLDRLRQKEIHHFQTGAPSLEEGNCPKTHQNS